MIAPTRAASSARPTIPMPERTPRTMPCASRVLTALSATLRSFRCTSGNPPAPWPTRGLASNPRHASSHQALRWLPEVLTSRPGSLATASPPSPRNSAPRSPTQVRAEELTASVPTAMIAQAASPTATTRRPSRAVRRPAIRRITRGASTAAAAMPSARRQPRPRPALSRRPVGTWSADSSGSVKPTAAAGSAQTAATARALSACQRRGRKATVTATAATRESTPPRE